MSRSTPLPRQIPRREVLAFIALNTDELHAPERVRFREYRYGDEDWRVISIDVETEADVHWWAEIFGHVPDQFSTFRYAGDVPPWSYFSSSGRWRGWRTEISASVRDDQPPPPDKVNDETAARLREIAGPDIE